MVLRSKVRPGSAEYIGRPVLQGACFDAQKCTVVIRFTKCYVAYLPTG